ncbi:MAG TPA: alpha-L-rhamnosidase, partial [Clostridiales bacterium]|nr:alpha-L-rhamnosidase [Clostridiales bacterium]
MKVENWPEEVKPENFRSVAVYSDLRELGHFSCSEEKLNRLMQNISWSRKSNFLDIPTDCPTRERAGWTGDINVFSESACYLTDPRTFLKKWLRDFVL